MKKDPYDLDAEGSWEEWFKVSEKAYDNLSKEDLIEHVKTKTKQVGRFGMERDRLKGKIEIYERMLSLLEDVIGLQRERE